MKLHENQELFQDAVRATAQEMGILDIYVEKDYWVTHALKSIFEDAIGKETVFKGGTALSKCFGMIERFSEDIDLVVLSKKGESNNQLTKKIKTIGQVVSMDLPEIEIEGITHKMGMNRKTAHKYEKQFKGNFGQVRDVIIVEATWLGYFEPYTTCKINALVYNMMLSKGQEQVALDNGLLPFEVNVLEPIRTICEKVMSLVRFSYSEDPLLDLKNKIRHSYDLYLLLQNKVIKEFFYSDDFDKMLLKVANDDIKSYKSNNEWLKYHPTEALIFKNLDEVWNELEKTYSNIQEFAGLVYGDLPEPENIKINLETIKIRLKKVTWTINIQ